MRRLTAFLTFALLFVTTIPVRAVNTIDSIYRERAESYQYDERFHFVEEEPYDAYVGEKIHLNVYIDPKLRMQFFQWQFGDREEDFTDDISNYTFTYDKPGDYIVVLSSRDQNGVEHVATLDMHVDDKLAKKPAHVLVTETNFLSTGIGWDGIVEIWERYPLFFLIPIIIVLIVVGPKQYKKFRQRKMREVRITKERNRDDISDLAFPNRATGKIR